MKIEENFKIVNENELNQEIEARFDEIIKKPEIVEALDLLDKLPLDLKYHDKNHTFDVLKETILFALADRLDKETLEQQTIAAAWHDVGFIESDSENESIAVELFEKSETYKKLSDEHRKEIIASILDTQVVIVDTLPKLSQLRSRFGYMLDADVSNFGRIDFFEKLKLVAEEQGVDLNDSDSKKKFLKFVIELLKNHDWKTDSATMLRQEQKEINLKLLEEEYLKI
jgi:hypothetical protein